jgi:hypothetical protein
MESNQQSVESAKLLDQTSGRKKRRKDGSAALQGLFGLQSSWEEREEEMDRLNHDESFASIRPNGTSTPRRSASYPLMVEEEDVKEVEPYIFQQTIVSLSIFIVINLN